MSNDSASFSIKVKTLDSTEYELSVTNVKTIFLPERMLLILSLKDTTVLELKQRLAELSGIPLERQRVIFRGRVLNDERSLRDYKVEEGNALHLVSRAVSSGTETNSRNSDNNVSPNETPQEGMVCPFTILSSIAYLFEGLPRGASVFIGSMNIPIGADEVTGVAGSIIQSIQQMMRFAQSRPQFSGQNTQPQNTEQVS